MTFVIYNSAQDVENFRTRIEKIAQHFGSDAMAEAYLNGFIDWNGKEICECPDSYCTCGDPDWY